MSLIVFQATQRISFQRFALSVLSGAVLLLVLGILHSWLYGMPHYIMLGTVIDGRLLLLAAAMGIILTVIYFDTPGPAAWNVRTMVETRKQLPVMPVAYAHAANIRRLFAYVIAGDILLFGFGLHILVWQQVMQHRDIIYSIGSMALASIALFLPIHYAAMLQLDAYTDGVSAEVCAFAQHRFGQILYWVLIVFWACLFAAYVLLLLYGYPYCRFLKC